VAARSGEHRYDAELHRLRGLLQASAGDAAGARASLEVAKSVALAQGAAGLVDRVAHDLDRLAPQVSP
jgi:hypothetical protein